MDDNPSKLSFTDLEAQWAPLINKFSYKYIIPGYEPEDLAQELRLILLKSQKLYNSDRGTKFITYLYKAFDFKLIKIWRGVQGRKKNVPANLVSYIGYTKKEYPATTRDNIGDIDLLTGLGNNARQVAEQVLMGNTKRKDWLAAGMNKEEVKSGLFDLRLALRGGKK